MNSGRFSRHTRIITMPTCIWQRSVWLRIGTALVIYNLKALTYNREVEPKLTRCLQQHEKDGQLQNAVIRLQNYQQSCDPTEQDSLQKQIDRIAKIVGKPVGKYKEDQEIRIPHQQEQVKCVGICRSGS